MVSGVLLFTGGPLLADQSKSGTQSQSDGTKKGSKSGSTAERSKKPSHESSGKVGVEPFGRTDVPKTGGEATLGGSGKIPDSSMTNAGKGSAGEGTPDAGAGSGNTGSTEGTGSSGDTGSSGGATGSSGGTGGGY